VDGDTGHRPDHPEVVHGRTSALWMTVDQGEQAGRGRVHPVEPTGCPTPGLVEVDDWLLVEQQARGGEERLGGLCCLGDHLGEGTDRHRCTEHVREQLGHPVEGKVLMDGQVGGQRSDAGSVTGRGDGRPRERRPGGAPAPAPPPFGHVLGETTRRISGSSNT